MIKLPEEIVYMIQTIENAGFEAYAVGGCVRDSIRGKQPGDWDLTSNAPGKVLESLFPDAAIVNKKLGVMRITRGTITADIAKYRIEGEYKDYRRPDTVMFTDSIEEDLQRRDFTMNAIAVSPLRGEKDPYHGRADIQNRLIRGIGDPGLRFEEDALRILRGIRFAAQLDFEIENNTLKAIKEKVRLLANISTERIREELFKILSAGNSGKGLSLSVETDALTYILGEDCIKNAKDEEWEKLHLLAENIDNTECRLEFRIPLIYLCFEKNNALKAIEVMGYSNEMKKKLELAIDLPDEFLNIQDKIELKRLLRRIGQNNYEYLLDLKKQQCIAFELDDITLKKQTALFKSIINKEAVFIKDLTVKGSDLKKIGINEGTQIGQILEVLIDFVHKEPEKNKKDILIQKAECLQRTRNRSI